MNDTNAVPQQRASEVKFCALDLKTVTLEGTFEGYASLFNREDLGRDIVMPGAFRNSLSQRGCSGVKMLFQHDPNQPIGIWERIYEDARGLFARGRIMTEVTKGREVLAMMREGAIDGLSIGFRAVNGKRDRRSGVRRLRIVDLWEISIVTFPMQPDARVSSVKADPFAGHVPSRREFERWLTRDAGFSRSEAHAVMRDGFDGFKSLRDAGTGPEWEQRLAGQFSEAARLLRQFAINGKDETMINGPGSGQSTLETKRLGDGEVGEAFGDFMRAFEAFKDTNDQRLDEIEQRMGSDALTDEKLVRIDKALDDHKRVVDDLVHKAVRPQLGGGLAKSSLGLQHKSAFNDYVRKGNAAPLRDLEAKALSVGSDPDGGYLVPDETETTINGALKDISPIRAIAGVRQVSGSVYKKPFAITGAATGWVGETAARPETNSPTLAELAFPTMELYAMPSATQSLLDDSAVDIDQWIADEVRTAFAEQEGTAFVNGDGVSQPRGFLTYTTVDNGSWTWGNIGTVPTGVSAAFPASDPADVLIDLAYSVKSGHRANAHFVMNRATQSVVRKMKDADGSYLWQPGLVPGQSPTLMGFSVAEAEDMPDITADSHSIAFGDFQRGYLIVDRVGIRVLRDPYSAKPYVLFYTTKRVGGGVQDFDAIKFLRFGV